MFTARATVTTEHASRYLQQLAKHWAHKYPVTFDPATARIELNDDRLLVLDAHPGALAVSATAPTEDALAHFKGVIETHIQRFAFRETLVFDWATA